MIRRFFGDAEYTFSLKPALIAELERKTDLGIGALFASVAEQSYRLADLTETIRLGLIGGGTAPATADALVRTYVATEGNPLIEAQILAVEILSDLFAGPEKADA